MKTEQDLLKEVERLHNAYREFSPEVREELGYNRRIETLLWVLQDFRKIELE